MKTILIATKLNSEYKNFMLSYHLTVSVFVSYSKFFIHQTALNDGLNVYKQRYRFALLTFSQKSHE